MDDVHSIRIDSLDEAGVRALIRVGEPGGVEFKVTPSAGGFGPSVAAFANTQGGWVLVGVGDDGTIRGFELPGRVHPDDWLREQLRRDVDPLPDFRAKAVPTTDGIVLAVRIPASSQTSHVLREKGVVYVREPGGKRRVDSQAKLILKKVLRNAGLLLLGGREREVEGRQIRVL